MARKIEREMEVVWKARHRNQEWVPGPVAVFRHRILGVRKCWDPCSGIDSQQPVAGIVPYEPTIIGNPVKIGSGPAAVTPPCRKPSAGNPVGDLLATVAEMRWEGGRSGGEVRRPAGCSSSEKDWRGFGRIFYSGARQLPLRHPHWKSWPAKARQGFSFSSWHGCVTSSD